MTTARVKHGRGRWVGGLARWTKGETAYLSIAFTWKVPEARRWATYYRRTGHRVIAGGPALFTSRMRKLVADVAEVPTKFVERRTRNGDVRRIEVLGDIPDALARHNPMATKASEGCPVDCVFCIVPGLEGVEFTYLPDFTPRPVLTDNNLSALPAEYQQHIVDRYRAAGVPLLDANSGFEPKTFDEDVFERWRPINQGPWRFGSDESGERADVERVIRMLRRRGVSSRKIQVYVMIGNEPFAACMERIRHVIELGGEPYVQPEMKLNALVKEPWVRFDWTRQRLSQVQRWANRHLWRKTPRFEDYDASAKTRTVDRYDAATGLFA